MTPLFSIITVSFNSEKTIERTIKSILNQTEQNYEYIIIDGGSTDGTINIIKKYESLFSGKLQWVSEPDFGIYNAMNKGIKKSKGQIIGIVNSDDWLEMDALKIVKKYFYTSNNSTESIYCGEINFWTVDNSSIILKTNPQQFKKKATTHYTLDGIRHPAVFVPKEVYNKYGMFDENFLISADADFLLRLYFSSVNFIFIDRVLSNMSDGGVSNSSSNKSVRDKCYLDYKLRLSKYDIPKFRKTYLKMIFLGKQRFKSLLPSKMIGFLRNIKN